MELIKGFLLLCVPFVPTIIMVVAVFRLYWVIRWGKRPLISLLYPVFLVVIYAFILFLEILNSPDGFTAGLISLFFWAGGFFSIVTAVPVAIAERGLLGRKVWLLLLVTCLLMPGSAPASGWVSDLAAKRCNEYNIRNGDILVNAIDRFHDRNNSFPFRLTDLVPDYVEPRSLSTCFTLFHRQISDPVPEWGGFAYKDCSPGVVQISIPEMGYSGQYQIYDFGQKSWSVSHFPYDEEERRALECNPIFIERKNYD